MDFLKEINELIQVAIKHQHPLLQNYRNVKTDFEYLKSNNPKLSDIDILIRMRNERGVNAQTYKEAGKKDLEQNEVNELIILDDYIPKEPSKEEVLEFLNTLSDIEKSKKNFKKFQEKCENEFGMKVDSKIILQFIDA